jgi:hypothetical protein
VVRVVAPGKGSVSYGSGTLVDVKGDYGLIITNYHVINEATGNISVIFPDGFYSLATVRKVDRDWDLAALVIKRPNVTPVPMASVAPRPGEPLTIAGYGSGDYRAVAGRCTQYVAPGNRLPFEMVELAASARQGDSGGPILNNRGELAGVLFGEGGGRTAGSYCGRVQWFLASLTDRPSPFASQPNAPAMPEQKFRNSPEAIAESMSPRSPVIASVPDRQEVAPEWVHRPRGSFAQRPPEPMNGPIDRSPLPTSIPASSQVAASSLATPQTGEVLSWSEIAGDNLSDQAKTFMAIFGCCAVVLQALRLLGKE